MNYLPATLLCDFYKISHREMYPSKTQTVYATWTPRGSRVPDVDEVVVAGNQMLIKEFLMDFFDENFFERPAYAVEMEYKRVIKHCLGIENPDAKHILELHALRYLPLLIKGLPEGTVIPLRCPAMTIQNTDPKFFWLTNYVESLASCEIWPVYTAATIARQYRKILDAAAMRTVGNTDFVQFQGHDFSLRGMMGVHAAVKTGIGHLLSFVGTDTIPAILACEQFYHANIEKELVGTSIPASEHSIQCAIEDDLKYITRLITEVHPTGFVSVVCDGYDFWKVIREVIPALKDKIMARSGGPLGDRVVIRPDSGDPVKIVCGDPESGDPFVRKGAVECLWDIFGGTMTNKGFKLLDSHIGLIYGDAITLERATEIVNRLEKKGFASINCVFGIGSYTYQYVTRDTFGFALKTTAAIIDGVEKQIWKDPKTDDGTKKSQKGRVAVYQDDEGNIKWQDGYDFASSPSPELKDNLLVPIFEDGELLVDDSLADIRKRLARASKPVVLA